MNLQMLDWRASASRCSSYSVVLGLPECLNDEGLFAAAMYGAAQDIGEAEIWIEQVRLELAAPLDRARTAERQDAVGELVRLVDSIVGDKSELLRLAQDESGICWVLFRRR